MLVDNNYSYFLLYGLNVCLVFNGASLYFVPLSAQVGHLDTRKIRQNESSILGNTLHSQHQYAITYMHAHAHRVPVYVLLHTVQLWYIL